MDSEVKAMIQKLQIRRNKNPQRYPEDYLEAVQRAAKKVLEKADNKQPKDS